MRLGVVNQTDDVGDYRLHFGNPIIDLIEVFYRDPRFDEVQKVTLGEQAPGLNSAEHALANISFSMSPGQQLTFWIRLTNNGANLLSLDVFEERLFEEYERVVHLLWGTLIGLTLVLSLYNFVLYIGLRDRTYLYYIGYLLAIFTLLGAVHGFGYYVMPVPWQQWLSQKMVTLQTLSAIASLQFAAAFLRVNVDSGRLFKIKNASLACMALFGFVALFLTERQGAPFFALVQTVTYLLVVWMIAQDFRSRFYWTRYYLISWIPFFIGAAIGLLLFVGLVEYNFYTRHALMISVIIEMALISMALADRMSVTEKERFFQATHDVKTGLANEYYFEQKVNSLQSIPQAKSLAVLAVKFSNYDYVTPYLSAEKQKQLLIAMASQFKDLISQQVPLLSLDDTGQVQTSVIQNSTFLFLVSLTNPRQLSMLLSALSAKDNHNPIPDQIPFRIQCVLAARLIEGNKVEARVLINSLKQCLNIAQQQNSDYLIYHSELDHSSARGIRLAQELERAIENDALLLYFQPQLQLKGTNRCFSEVLVRWIHPDMGFISPAEFVLIAEQTGLIKKLTAWVLRRAFLHQHDLKKVCGEDAHISINISANDLSRDGFASEVFDIAQEQNVKPENFTLEVTETSHQQDQAKFSKNIVALKQAGFSLAIDDFGTGYSSLTYVSELPFDELKIDRAFVKDLLTSERQHQIVSATIRMANDLGLSVTAEGIEDEATQDQLVKLACDKIQGYFYARPMPFDDYVSWLNQE